MIASRARAMTLLGTAFVLGFVVGGAGIGMAARAGRANWIWHGKSRPPQNNGYGTRLARTLRIDIEPVKRDSITAYWCRGMLAMDSISQPIRASTDSLFQGIRPRIDSLYQPIRPAVESRRSETRGEIRALLTPPQAERYDSMNRADDEQRKRRDPGPSPSGNGSCPSSPGGPGPRGGFDRGSH